MPKIWSNFAQRTPAVLDFPLGGRSRETGGVNGGGKGANGGGGGNGIDVLTQRSVVSTAGNSRASFGKFPFLKWNYVSSISFCKSGWLKYFRICLQYMFIFLYQWYLLTHRRWPRRGELLYPAALFRLLGEIFLIIIFVTPTECWRYIWTSGRHLTFKCPSGFVLSHQHKEVFILYFTYSKHSH